MAQTTTSAPQQQVNMPAVDLRQMLGSFVSTEGVRLSTDLLVSQRGAGANMSVDVAAGSCVIQDDDASGGGFYAYTLASTFNVTIAASDPTNPRVDRIVVRIRDAYLGDPANDSGPVVLAGTPTGGATLANCTGAQSVPDSCLVIANVLVSAGVTSIVTAKIDTTGASNDSPAVRHVLALSGSAVPAGVMPDYGGTSAPTGYLMCDGSAVSRTTYAALFAAIGTLWGVGDGSTTFNLPDYRGRVAVGYAPSGGHVDVSTIGLSESSAVANRRPKHPHTNGVTISGSVSNNTLSVSDNLNFLIPKDSGGAGTDSVIIVATGTHAATYVDIMQKSGSASLSGSISNGTLGIAGTVGVSGTASDTPAYAVSSKIIKT